MDPRWIALGVATILGMNIAISVLVNMAYSKVETIEDVVRAPPDPPGDTIQSFLNAENIRKHLRAITKKGHVSGTSNNLEVAQYLRNEMISQGLEGVHFNAYDVLLSYPDWKTPNTLEILSENGTTLHKTSGRSPAIIKEEQTDHEAELQWFAYSANGVVEGDVVYVNGASHKDFEHLISLGITLKDKIFLARHTGVFRANIAQNAVHYGAKGCLVYSDPVQVASWGTGPNETFSSTDKMPPNAVQRGTLLLGTGDPRTPAFPSIKGLHREKDEEQLYAEKRIPTIPVLPIPYNEAQKLFERMNGEEVVAGFRGKLEVTYRYGPGLIDNQKIRLTVHARNEERTIQNVMGYIKGHEESEKLVVIGNHYDAWTYGAIDPNSGTATLLEVSRALKAYQNSTGWVPARSILFAHWDTEEYGLMGSTEFAEEFRVQLMSRAVALINVDVIAGNQTLHTLASPVVANVLREVAGDTVHPNAFERENGRNTILDSWKHFTAEKRKERGQSGNKRKTSYCGLPAGGSDQTAFFDYLGVPVIWFMPTSLDAYPAYPLYHTIYETPYLTEHILDPEFKMHKTIAEMVIKMAVKFTDAQILPYDLQEFMDDVEAEYLPALADSFYEAQDASKDQYFALGLEQFNFLKQTVQDLSDKVHQRNATKLAELPLIKRIDENRRLMEFEKCFLNPQGSPGHPEARHLLYHPSSKDWYKGGVMQQVHNVIGEISSTSDEKKLKNLEKKLAMEISKVSFGFICATHSLDSLPGV